MKNSMLKRRVTRTVIPACAALFLGGIGTSCSDDLLTGQPSWLGESIYKELETRGNFTETLKLINAQDEDYASVLQKTGSKTLFVADDQAWQAFYQKNAWGITSLESMTAAQKKLLFKANMVNSAYLVELLGNLPTSSSTETPQEGACLRRSSSVDLMDSVPIVTKAQFPVVNPARVAVSTNEQIDYWGRLRGKDSIPMLMDDGVASMIHFMPKFMQNNNITSADVEFLTNGDINSNEGAFVNGRSIIEKDITCQNGYIHILEGVALPLDNMANVISTQPQFSIYSRLLDRFSYPHFDQTITDDYQRVYGGKDSVYVKRYFNEHTLHPFNQTDDKDGKKTVTNLLPFDPGWNRYYLNSTNTTYQQDAAVMMVPTDEAMRAYLQGNGSDLNERYKDAGPGETAWDNAPDEVILPLLRNTMLPSLKSAIPSQFASINNTASEPMGVEKADIDKVLWACNGVIYQTNKVYVAPEYVSVFYPCVIRANEDLNLTYSVINKDRNTAGGEGFYAYLNNMGSKYSYVIPTDNALQTYYDPVSYRRTLANGTSTAVAYKYYVNDQGTIAAYPYLVDWTTLDEKGRGAIAEQSTTQVSLSTTFDRNGDVFNHFTDIINSSLCTSLFVPGQKFYEARNGGPVVVEWDGSKVTGVAGSFQYERGYYIPVTEVFDKSVEGNGRSYIIDEEPLMSTFTSPYAALTDSLRENQFGSFANLLASMDIISTNDGANHVTMDNCLTNLNNYHYTIYVPTNASIDALTEAHKLPTWDDVDNVMNSHTVAASRYYEIADKYGEGETPTEEDSLAMLKIAADTLYLYEQMQTMKNVINNFVLYHIQDNSVYVEGANHANDVFESACLDPQSNRFVKIYVNYELGGQMQIVDNSMKTHLVDPNCCNILTRQYYFNGKDLKGNSSSRIYSSSFAVIHQIDTPLEAFPVSEENPMGVYYNPTDYAKVEQLLAAYPVVNDVPTPTPTPTSIKRKR